MIQLYEKSGGSFLINPEIKITLLKKLANYRTTLYQGFWLVIS